MSLSELQHDFGESLSMSHAASDLSIWRKMYEQAFPYFLAMHDHRQDGDHQRNGIDRSIILANSKQILIDEKVRGRNKKTGLVYDDIALEYLSDRDRSILGWVCKPLLCDYIAYAIAPLGKGYVLPVPALQAAWLIHGERWKQKYQIIPAPNRDKKSGREWLTLSVGVPEAELFSAIGKQLRIKFIPFEV